MPQQRKKKRSPAIEKNSKEAKSAAGKARIYNQLARNAEGIPLAGRILRYAEKKQIDKAMAANRRTREITRRK